MIIQTTAGYYDLVAKVHFLEHSEDPKKFEMWYEDKVVGICDESDLYEALSTAVPAHPGWLKLVFTIRDGKPRFDVYEIVAWRIEGRLPPTPVIVHEERMSYFNRYVIESPLGVISQQGEHDFTCRQEALDYFIKEHVAANPGPRPLSHD